MTNDRRTLQRVGDVVDGTCVFWHAGSRYGFIRVPGISDDVFVGWRALQASSDLREGERVRCELTMGDRGRYSAAFVEILDGVEEERTA